MSSSAIAALESSLQQHLPAELRELKLRVRQLEDRVHQLEEQQLSSCLRADGTRKTWQEVAMSLRRAVAEARDDQELGWGLMHQATELLEVARARAGRADTELFEASGRSAPQQAIEAVHNILCDAISILEDGAAGPPAEPPAALR